MGWTSYYTHRTNKEECLHIVSGYKGTVKKTVMQGNKFFALMSTPSNEDWVLLLLTSRSKGVFYYKDIQCNPYEHGIPASILKEFKPSNEADAKWLKENLEILEEKKKEPKFEIGDVVKCVAPYDIEWGNYTKVTKDSVFYVKVERSGKKGKLYRLVRPDGDHYSDTNCRLMNKTFGYIKNKEKAEHLLTFQEKMEILQNIVINECNCLWDLFCENINNVGQVYFILNLRKCNDEEDIRKLVNQYI